MQTSFIAWYLARGDAWVVVAEENIEQKVDCDKVQVFQRCELAMTSRVMLEAKRISDKGNRKMVPTKSLESLRNHSE